MGTASVTVTAGPLDRIAVDPSSVALLPNRTQAFAATGYDQYDNEVSGVKFVSEPTFTWTVVNGGGAIDSSGVFTAGVVAGIYTDTVQAEADGVTETATVIVTTVDSVAVEPPSATLIQGGTQHFTATASDKDGRIINGVTFTWTVATGDSGTIDSNGVFTAGTTLGTYPDTVQATTEGITGTASVTVTTLARVAVEPPSATLAPEETQAFTATGYDPYDNEIDGLSFDWAVVNGGGTIDGNGLFTAGTTAGTYPDTVQATTEGINGTASVTVTPGALARIDVDPLSVTLAPNQTQAFTATGYDAHDNMISGLSFTWAVVNGGGTINSSGLFTAGTAVGEYSNTVRATSGSINGRASVTIEYYYTYLPMTLRNRQ